MKKIRLVDGSVALIDDEDYDLVRGHRWTAHKGYAVRSKDTKYMHNLVMETNDGMEVGHVNRDHMDNRRCNLRECTHAENMRNMTKQSGTSSIYKGVSHHAPSGRWRAYVTVSGKYISLGYYGNQEDAAVAYDKGALKHHGKFVSLNKPEDSLMDPSMPDCVDIYDHTCIQKELLVTRSPVNELEHQELVRIIRMHIASLSARDRMVISLRYGIDDKHAHTLKSIGDLFNITRERVRQIEKKALSTLRARFKY